MLSRRLLSCVIALGLLAQQKPPVPPAVGDFDISGTVVDSATGQPLSNTRVVIAPISQGNSFTTVITTDSGRFSFSGLAPGKYTLMAQHRGYLTQAFNQHEQFSSSIAVGPNRESTNLLFRLIHESAISGTVTDEQDDPLRDAKVMLFQSSITGGIRSTRQRASATTDDEGSYRFAHLPSGRYFIAVASVPWYAQRPTAPQNARTVFAERNSVSSQGPGSGGTINSAPPPEEPPSPLDVAYPITFYSSATDSAGATAIALGKGERASADVSLHPVPALHIRVATGNSDPAQQAYPVLEERLFEGTPVSLRTQSVEIAPGVMELVGIAPGHYSMAISSWKSGGQIQSQPETEVDFTESGELDAVRKASLVPLTAAIHFETAASIPVQGTIQLRDKESGRGFSAPINGKDEIEFEQSVPPGGYEVSLVTDRGVFIRSVSATGAKSTGRTLEIKGSGSVKLSLLLAQGEGTVTGVALRGGRPFAGAMIVLVPADPANNGVLFRRDQSDSDGTFALANVVPGQYTVLAIENGWDLEWANPAVLAKFIAQGEPLTVESKGKYSVKVKVQ